MRFGVLGPVEVRLPDGSPVAVGGPLVRSLLAMLLLDAGRTVSADRLVDGLYGTAPPADVGHALQSQVSRLRRGLRGAATVDFGPAGYRLAVSPDAVDAHEFARLASEGRRAADPARASALLGAALDLWRGPALADVLDAPFAPAEAARLADERLAVVEDRAAAALRLGEHHAVAAELTSLVAEHPLRERARALLMRALYAAGRQAEALAVFEEARRLLDAELGVDPSAELAEAHLAILRATPVPRARRVPAQLTSFVGRSTELSDLAELLDRARLVTLTGPGGTGKTRLSVEVAGRVAGEVCFADLAPLTDASQLAPALATALGLQDDESRLVAALSDRSVLLILDNCEHLVAGAAALAHRLLAECPSVRILATSREPLGITGEALFPVGQLDVPSPSDTFAEALASPAVRLFADRAAAVRPGFAVDAATIGAVGRICAALDGLPLAIELAAARLRSLTLDEVDARLADRFRLLSRGSRTAAPRHQTLQAVVAWSWDLFGPAEQTLARRFTVFAGGAVLADVTRVCDVPDAEDVLADLVDKSLVEVHGGRYRMLETVRSFCAARLVEDVARAHASHFVELAETAELRGPDQLTWLARLSAEHANLLAALRWAVDAEPALASRLVAALSWFWWLQGLRGTVAPLAARLLSRLTGDEPAEEYAFCAAAAGAELDRAAALLVDAEGPLRRPYVVFLLAMSGRMLDGDPRPGLLGDDPWSRAFRLMGEGLGARDEAAAEDAFTAALAGFRATGDRWGVASALDKLAAITADRGDHGRALALMDEAIALASELGGVADTPDLHTRRADILAGAGDMAGAREGYVHALTSAHAAGAPDLAANARRGLGDLAHRSGDLTAARDHYTTALAECPGTSVGAQETRTRILAGLRRVDGE